MTYLADPGSYGLSSDHWRYIHYASGDEELYDCQVDPYEWTNLAGSADHAVKLEELRALGPKTFAPLVPPKDESLPKLKWRPAGRSPMPVSRPEGPIFDIVLINQHGNQANVYTIDAKGKRKSRGLIPTGWRIRGSTQPGSVWLITDIKDNPLGYFIVGDHSARGIIPAPHDR